MMIIILHPVFSAISLTIIKKPEIKKGRHFFRDGLSVFILVFTFRQQPTARTLFGF
jgi:hypothetical protein